MSHIKTFPDHYENVELSYFKGGKISGSTQVNSFARITCYEEYLPESIVISNIGPIGKLCSKFKTWQEPMSYSRTSGYYYLPSKNFGEFLDLAAKDDKFMKSYYFSQTDFDNIVTTLKLEAIPFVNIGLTDDEYNKYLEEHGSIVDLKERIMYYVMRNTIFSQDPILKLMKKYLETNPVDTDLISAVLPKITSCCGSTMSLSILRHESIRNLLRNSPHIKEISVFEGSWLERRTEIWNALLDLITNLPNLKEIRFSSTWSTKYGDQFPVELLASLSDAIKLRTTFSLEKIEFIDNRWYRTKSEVVSFLENIKSIEGIKLINLYGSISRNDLPTNLPFKIHAE
jgi:hypothetical protein